MFGCAVARDAVALAARELKKKIAEAFCKKLGCMAEDVRFKDNFICGRSDTERIAFDDAMRTDIHARVRRIAEGAAAAHGTTVRVEIQAGYPVTKNDPALTQQIPALVELYF